MTLPFSIPPWLKEGSLNWNNPSPSTPFHSPSPKDDDCNWGNRTSSTPSYSSKNDGCNWTNHPSPPVHNPKLGFNQSSHHSPAPFYSPADDAGYWKDHPTSASFQSPKKMSSTYQKFSSPLLELPSSFMNSKLPNFDSSNEWHPGSDSFNLPLKEWKSAPLLPSPKFPTLKPHQTVSFENCWTPLPPPPTVELRFEALPSTPRGSLLGRFTCSPLSDDSGYSGDSELFDTSWTPFSPASPSLFTAKPELGVQKPGVRGKKRELDDDLQDCPPHQPNLKRKRVDAVQSNDQSGWSKAAAPSWMKTRMYPLVISKCISPLQRDLDVIFRSIIEVLLCYSDIEGLCSNRDAIVAEMKATSDSYSRNNLAANSSSRRDFKNWKTRWGYMYMYLMRHAHLVFHSLKQIHLSAKMLPPLANNNWNTPFDHGGLHTGVFMQKCQQPGGFITVCAIGGGPGSDLIGLALFLRANRLNVKIRAHVFDKCMDWQKSWADLLHQLPDYISGYFESVCYVPFDYLTATLLKTQAEIIRKADLVTMVKSLSAVAKNLLPTSNANGGRNSLFEILSSVSPGCIVLYLDNKSGTPGRLFKEEVQRIKNNPYTIVYCEISNLQLPSNGFSLASCHFKDWVSYGPCFSSGTNEIVALSRKWMMEF